MTEFLSHFEALIKREFPKFKPTLENELFYQMTVQSLSYKKIRDFVYSKTDEKFDKMLRLSQLSFLKNTNNKTHYRNLSGQYLLQKYPHLDTTEIENILLGFSRDESLDENLRADACDILMQLGKPENQKIARKIINIIGSRGRSHLTIYENSQNVHSTEVEKFCGGNIRIFIHFTFT